MYDIITIGSATRDMFMRSKAIRIKNDPASKTGKSLALDLGSKVNVDELYFETGGSALNAAVTFANQGLKVGVLAKVGDDVGGRAITEEMKSQDIAWLTPVDTQHKECRTAYSAVLASPTGERSILVYRGVTTHLHKKDILWNKLKQAKWWYVTHLSGESAKQFRPLLKFAQEHNISVALNPGHTQLSLGKDLTLQGVNVCLLNREEASELTGISYKKEQALFLAMNQRVGGICVMTEGSKGVKVSDGESIWSAAILEEPRLVDRTGAGDAFGSGFVSVIIKGGSVEEAIQLGSANATGVLGVWGAHKGLLKPGESPEKFGKIKIEKKKIS